MCIYIKPTYWKETSEMCEWCDCKHHCSYCKHHCALSLTCHNISLSHLQNLLYAFFLGIWYLHQLNQPTMVHLFLTSAKWNILESASAGTICGLMYHLKYILQLTKLDTYTLICIVESEMSRITWTYIFVALVILSVTLLV
jgi:hypothetical protein